MTYRRIFLYVWLCFIGAEEISASDWETLMTKGSGKVNIYYYPTEPFIYKDENGSLVGIEKEILESFFGFLERKYEVTIFRNWIELETFDSLFARVSAEKNAIGISLISKTNEREKRVSFSNAYMPDVSVLISNIAVPYIKDSAAASFLKDFDAATLNYTVYQDDLLSLSTSFDLNLRLINVATEADVIELVGINERIIGYVGLPYYIIYLSKNNPVKRQSIFQVKRDGYRFIYNKASGWDNAVSIYFESFLYKSEANNIIRKYLGNDYSELIWGMAENDENISDNTEIDFLNREKELQSLSLLQFMQQKERQRWIILAVSLVLLFLIIIAILLITNNKRKSQVNKTLSEKSGQLEELLDQLNERNNKIASQRRQLQQKNKQLVEINKKKDDLIGLVAHDLKSPINQMNGLINLLGYSNDKWSDDEKQLFEKLSESNAHLKDLVVRILDMEVLNEEQLNYHIEKVDMVQLMQEVVSDFKSTAEAKNIVIKTAGFERGCFVKADAFFLKQAFQNLMSNAIKFSDLNSEVRLRAAALDEHYQMNVIDKGPGILKEELPKLFVKYQTLSAKPTAQETSTGLGLSIVKKYVKEMGGEILVDSTPGKGATFSIRFKKA